MTFASDVARSIYHSLPTQVQVDYSRLEEFLANTGKQLHVESVMSAMDQLEVVVRVREEIDLSASAG